MHSWSPTEAAKREVLPFRAYHVVEDARTSIERRDASLSFCGLSCGASKLSLELLPHHLPSLRTKERSDLLLCFDDGHMTPLVGFLLRT